MAYLQPVWHKEQWLTADRHAWALHISQHDLWAAGVWQALCLYNIFTMSPNQGEVSDLQQIKYNRDHCSKKKKVGLFTHNLDYEPASRNCLVQLSTWSRYNNSFEICIFFLITVATRYLSQNRGLQTGKVSYCRWKALFSSTEIIRENSRYLIWGSVQINTTIPNAEWGISQSS